MPTTAPSLASLKRRDLLQLCKEHGIKAVGKNSELIERLQEAGLVSPAVAHDPEPHDPEPHDPEPHEPVLLHAPATPGKTAAAQEALAPILGTPLGASLANAIVSSVRKTGIMASPLRVPFALSPIALAKNPPASHELKKALLATPIHIAAEPSQPIRDAFQAHADERVDEQVGGLVDERVDERVDEQVDEPWASSSSSASTLPVLSGESGLYGSKRHSNDLACSADDLSQQPLPYAAVASNPKEPRLDEPGVALQGLGLQPNASEPALGWAVSPATFIPADAQGWSRSASSSGASSRSQDELLPSGIKKLLEKRRQERLQRAASSQQSLPQPTNHARSKFNLAESLRRPLPYKPHVGPLSRSAGALHARSHPVDASDSGSAHVNASASTCAHVNASASTCANVNASASTCANVNVSDNDYGHDHTGQAPH